MINLNTIALTSIVLKNKDFKAKGGVHTAKVFVDSPLEIIEGFEKFHENSAYRSGRISIKIGKKVTSMYCSEDFTGGRLSLLCLNLIYKKD